MKTKIIIIILCVNIHSTIIQGLLQIFHADFENSTIVHRLKRATSSPSNKTSKKQLESSTQGTTEDPNVVQLREQLKQINEQREADKRKEAEMRKEERERQEQDRKKQEADVLRQRAEAEAKQPQAQGSNSSQNQLETSTHRTTEPDVKKNQTESIAEIQLDDEKRQEMAAQLVAQKYLRNQKNNDTLITELIGKCNVENCFNKIVKRAVEKILQKINVTTLIKTERKLNSSIEESTSMYKFVSDKIAKKDFTTWTEFAVRVKELMKMKTSSNVIDELKRIREYKIPRAIKNLIFSTKLCIRNVKYNEYLYAVGSPELWYDNNRRYVFTRLGGTRNDTGDSKEFFWRLENINGTNKFFVINHKFNEYLFIDSYKWDGNNRFVFTWTDDKPVTQHVWQILLNLEGNFFELKNTHSNEYLFADYDRVFEEKMRCVFTYTDGSNNIEGLWEFMNCSAQK